MLNTRPVSRRPLLYQETAQRLEKELPTIGRSDRLPPVPVLARQLRVSPTTVLKALHALRDRGLVSFSRGRPVVVGCSRAGVMSSGTARLYRHLKEEVMNGRLRAGASLGKLAGYSAAFGVSNSSVLQVFSILESEGIVHRMGKRRIVGKRQSAASPQRSIVAVVVPNPGYWRYYLANFHVAPLFQSLLWELDKYNIDVMLVMNQPTPWAGLYHAGIGAVAELVGGLGPRYRGMLLAGNIAGWKEWKEWMIAFGKGGCPVHFFCDNAAEAGSIRLIHAPRGCLRCCYDETATGALAAGVLAGRGHRRAAFMMNRVFRDDGWMRLREEAMAEAGKGNGLGVVAVDQDEPFWERSLSMDRLVLDLAGPDAVDPGRVTTRSRMFTGYEAGRDELVNSVPSLARVLADPTITAIVAPNDDLASAYYVWLRKMGMMPGRELSLLSFDNNYNALPYPVTTIDLGYRTLGYQLAHLFIRDVPVEVSPDGYLLSRPYLVDRGTVANLTRGSTEAPGAGKPDRPNVARARVLG